MKVINVKFTIKDYIFLIVGLLITISATVYILENARVNNANLNSLAYVCSILTYLVTFFACKLIKIVPKK